ncbi:hypothetical protein FE257_011780 [Aspergillus nanangensis]|uniref:Aspartate aminotransferase n=1 Tax=Aspergillus nanangensis TaxID=2582783 RepID=A0AAD4CVP5_ASPNN|nr:hypothetical protein FE257_011780 [Aspergillus nanangensis]
MEYLCISEMPPDPAFGLIAQYEADASPNKVSLIQGAYRDENGRPWILPCVKAAEQRLHLQANHEYLPITGSPALLDKAKDLVFGSEIMASATTITAIQTVSGTGANHLAAAFLATHLHPQHVFLPDPTWINHRAVWATAAPQVVQKAYPYYSATTRALDIAGMLSTLESCAVPNDVLVLQACAHNPTGLDLTRSQWSLVAAVVKRKRLFVVFDNAYQGFATGNPDADAWAIRHFVKEVIEKGEESDNHQPGMFVAQSFSKNFGLYGERVGVLHLVVPQHLSVRSAGSQLAALSRAEYSTPPRFGASIVEAVLGDEELRGQWVRDLETMSSRLKRMRFLLRSSLEKRGTPGDWAQVEEQIGMFSYTGLRREQVGQLRDEYHVYLMPSGRASICGLTEENVDYVADAIHQVLSG